MLGKEQARMLTALVHSLRPAWQEEGIFAALVQVRDRDPFEVALAALRAAHDPKAQTPGVIPSNGPHWNELPPSVPKQPVLSRGERRARTCANCGALDGCKPGCPGFVPLDHASQERTQPPADIKSKVAENATKGSAA